MSTTIQGGSDFGFVDIGIGNVSNLTPVKPNTQVQPSDSSSVETQGDAAKIDPSLKKQGIASVMFNLFMDGDVNISQEDAQKIVNQLGFNKVEDMQKALGVPPSGKLDSETMGKLVDFCCDKVLDKLGMGSIENFQKDQGLEPTGSVDEQTLFSIDNLIQNNINLLVESKMFEAMIKAIQVQLKMTDDALQLLNF